MTYFFYFIFFNAYWASFDLGESTIARKNAVYYMSLSMIFLLSAFVFGLSNLGFSINLTWCIVIGVAVILIVNHYLLSKEIFDRKYDQFKFIESYSKKKRIIIFFLTIGLAALTNLLCAFIFAI